MNKKFLFLPIALLVLGIGCTKDFPIGPNRNPTKGPSQINFTEHNLYPEGLAFDPLHNFFLVSSASAGTVGGVGFDGIYKPLIIDENLTMTTGLKVDKANRRVLVCNVENGLGSYDLFTGKRLFFADFTSLLPGEPVFLNDETFDAQGNAYVTNSASPVIYKVDKNGKASVFFQNAAFSTGPADFGFNGIQYNEKGFILVTHTALNQLIKIPVNNPASYSVVQLNTAITMPDGLLLSKDGRQVVVVSYDHVLSFISSDQWKSGIVSTSFFTDTNYPTSLTSNGQQVYVLYSPLDKFMNGEDHDIFTIKEVPLIKSDSF